MPKIETVDQIPLLRDATEKLYADYLKNTPDWIKDLKSQANERLYASGIADQCLTKGLAPDFILTGEGGSVQRLADLLGKGPVVISFFRGSWCRFCNLELAALQAIYPEIKRLGAELIALSPEKASGLEDAMLLHGLEFPVLSDAGNCIAAQFGLVTSMDESLHGIYRDTFGIDLQHLNADGSWQIPVTATYVIDPSGRIVLASADPDHTKRLEPRAIVLALKDMASRAGHDAC